MSNAEPDGPPSDAEAERTAPDAEEDGTSPDAPVPEPAADTETGDDTPEAAEADSEGPEPVGEPEYSPAPIAATVAVGAAVVAAAAAWTGGLAGIGPAGLGVGLVVAGTVADWHRSVVAGAGLGFVGVLVAGLVGAPPATILLGTVGAAVAYDAGSHAVVLGEQLREDARTTRAELLHVGATVGVLGGAAAVGYLGYLLGAGGRPVTGLVGLLLAALFLAWTLR